MARIVWSSIANEDLKNIASYIERDSYYYAKLTVQNIYKQIRKLKEFPFSGRMIPEYNEPNFREIIYGSYRIMYVVDSDLIKIITIVHNKQDIQNT